MEGRKKMEKRDDLPNEYRPERSSVIIVGAGAAGLTTAFHLRQAGWEQVRILEASPRIGGRVLRDAQTFAGVPVDLGAEWIHGRPAKILNPLLDRDIAEQLKSHIVAHKYGKISVWDGTAFYREKPDFGWNDHKWVDYTWFDFFKDHIVSALNGDDIVLNCPVTAIEYDSTTTTTPGCTVQCQNGEAYQADFVVMTVSMQQLQNNRIQFTPALPMKYQHAIDSFQMEPAIKVFLEFNQKFYPPVWVIERDWKDYSLRESSANYADRIFYDETFHNHNNNNSEQNIVGMFAYGAVARQFVEASSNDAVVRMVLAQLDIMFAGQATEHFVCAKVQNWAHVPYIETGYTRWVKPESSIGVLQTPLQNRILWAGEALPVDRENWGFVHGAALSGKAVARKIIKIAAAGTSR